MGNKQNKPAPSPMLKVESKALSCFDEQERPHKGIPRRIGSLLLTRWIELKRREQLILAKARAAVTDGHAPPSILEEFSEHLKEEAKQHRVKYHPKILANILASRPRPRPRLKVPKLTTTAARRIQQSFLRRDMERRKENEAKAEEKRTKSRISLRPQAWTDTMPRKITSATSTTRGTQTISHPTPLSRDISLRSFKTADSSGIGMSRASSMTSISSSKPQKLLYTRERGYSLSEDRAQRGDEDGEKTRSRQQRIAAQRKAIIRQKLKKESQASVRSANKNQHRPGTQTQQSQQQRAVLQRAQSQQHQTQSRGSLRRRKSEPEQNYSEALQRRDQSKQRTSQQRSSSQQHLSHEGQGQRDVQEHQKVLPQSIKGTLLPQTEQQQTSRKDRQRQNGQGRHEQRTSGRHSRRVSFPKLKGTSYQTYWRKRVIESRALKTVESGKDSTRILLPKGSNKKPQQEDDEGFGSSQNSSEKGESIVAKKRRRKQDELSTLPSRDEDKQIVGRNRQSNQGRDDQKQDQRPPYSFSQRRRRRFREVAEEFLLQASKSTRRSQQNTVTNNQNGQHQAQTIQVGHSGGVKQNANNIPEKRKIVTRTSSSHNLSSKQLNLADGGELPAKEVTKRQADRRQPQKEIQQSHRNERQEDEPKPQVQNRVTKQKDRHEPSREILKAEPLTDPQPGPSGETTQLSRAADTSTKTRGQENTRKSREREDAPQAAEIDGPTNPAESKTEKQIRRETSRHAIINQNHGQSAQVLDGERVYNEQTIGNDHLHTGQTIAYVHTTQSLNNDRLHTKQTLDHGHIHTGQSTEQVRTGESIDHNLRHAGQSHDHDNRHGHVLETHDHDQGHAIHSRDDKYLRSENIPNRGELQQHNERIHVIDHGRTVQTQQGSRNGQMLIDPRGGNSVSVGRSALPQGQSQSGQYVVQGGYISDSEGRGMKYLHEEYDHTEESLDYAQISRVDNYRNDAVYVERRPAAVYEGRRPMLQPLQRGTLMMSDGSRPRRWRRVSVVDVWELGEWERVRRAEAALLRSRSSSTPIPRAL